MSQNTQKAARQARHAAIRAAVAGEEAENAEAEAAEHIPTSALARRLLHRALHEYPQAG